MSWGGGLGGGGGDGGGSGCVCVLGFRVMGQRGGRCGRWVEMLGWWDGGMVWRWIVRMTEWGYG